MSETRYRQKLSTETLENGYENKTNGYPNERADKSDVFSENRLFKIDEMPEYLRFNPFVKNGYRRLMNVKQCCQSLLFFHNETVNIYTHGKYIKTLPMKPCKLCFININIIYFFI